MKHISKYGIIKKYLGDVFMNKFNYDDKNRDNSSTPATESTKFEINTNYSHGDYLRHSAEPNMANANDTRACSHKTDVRIFEHKFDTFWRNTEMLCILKILAANIKNVKKTYIMVCVNIWRQ